MALAVLGEKFQALSLCYCLSIINTWPFSDKTLKILLL